MVSVSDEGAQEAETENQKGRSPSLHPQLPTAWVDGTQTGLFLLVIWSIGKDGAHLA